MGAAIVLCHFPAWKRRLLGGGGGMDYSCTVWVKWVPRPVASEPSRLPPPTLPTPPLPLLITPWSFWLVPGLSLEGLAWGPGVGCCRGLE